MYKYPYGDSQQLNLDWILAKLKELEASGGSGGADLEEVSNALISLTYNTSTAYRRYDYAFLNGKLYRCLSDTSGVFDPSAWQDALIGDDLSVLTRWINAIDAAAVVDVKFDTSGTNGKIQQKYHDQYHDVVEVDYTPVQNSKRPLSSNAGYELNGALSGDTAISAESGLFTTTKFFRTTANIPLGSTEVTLKAYSRGVIISNNGTTGAIIATEYGGQTYIAYFDNSAIVSANTLFDNKNLQEVTPTMKNCTVTYTTRQCKYKYLSNNMLYVWTRIRGQITAVDSSPYALIDISTVPGILNFDGNYASVTLRESYNCCTTLPYNAVASKSGQSMNLQFQTDGGINANTWKVTPSGGTFYANISAIFIKP